jgi:membrane fusion protein, multidrug efflux system
MKKLAIVAGTVLGTIVAAVLLPSSNSTVPRAAAEGPPSAPAGPVVPVTAGTVTVADVPIVLNAIGTVQAFNMVTIKSRVDGQIMALKFTEGQDVEAGMPLVRIDPRPFEASLEQAKATKEKDEAQLASAQADLNRWAELVTQGYKSRQTYDQQKALVAQLQASIKGDEAQIDTAKLNLGFTDIRSPIAGRLGARLVDTGNMVRATDGTGLVTVAQLKPIFVSFALAQELAHKVRERQARVPLEVQAFGHDAKTLLATGKLTLIDNAIDQPTGTIRLKATFENGDERLWPGEFVNIRVILNMRKQVPTVPAQTVQDGPQGQYAYVIKDDSTVERRPVEVAAVQDGIAVISKGLAPGDKVVVDGQYRLTQGARIRASSPQANAAG